MYPQIHHFSDEKGRQLILCQNGESIWRSKQFVVYWYQNISLVLPLRRSQLDKIERYFAMRTLQSFKKINQDSIKYREEIEEHTRISQQVFSICLFAIFAAHIVIIHLLHIEKCERFYAALGISGLQMAISLLFYFLFKYHFSAHRKYIFPAAYLNIFQVVIILELQYLLHDEYISYTIIVCIVLCTSLSIIGHTGKYAAILTASLLADIAITITKYHEALHSCEMDMYFIDNFFILMIAIGINCSISRLKFRDFEINKQILYLSERDSLTGLLNRKSLECSVEKHAGSDGLCAMLLLDLDNFKALNDTLGHYEGDNCLRATADGLKQIFRSTDYVSRLGGDEFTVFLPNIQSVDFVIERADLLLKKIPRSYPHKEGEVVVTCSVGIAFLRMDQDDLYEKLYKAADSAMYRSKANGKNMVTVFENEYAPV